MKRLIFILTILIFISCNESTHKMKIIFYRQGKIINVNTSQLDLTGIYTRVKQLCENTTDKLRVYINEERIEQLKQTETALEIIFEKEVEISSPAIGTEKVKKIFFPLSGDFIGNDESPVITVFLGTEDYYYPDALRNLTGYKDLMGLKKMIGE